MRRPISGATIARIRASAKISAAAPPPPRSESLLDATAAAPVRESQEPVGQQRDGSDQHADEEREADVEVADVAHLVPDDALELLAIELVEQAARDRHARVLRIPPGGEGVRRRVVDDPEPRGREAARQAHLLDDVDELPEALRWIRAVDLARSAGRHHERVAREPGTDAHHDRDDHGQHEAAPAEAGRVPDRAPEQSENDDHHRHEQPAPAAVAVDLAIEGGRRQARRGAHRRPVTSCAGSPREPPCPPPRSGSSRARGSRTSRR